MPGKKSAECIFFINNPTRLKPRPLSPGGGGALRLQIRVWARGPHLFGLPRQSAAQPEGRVWALRQRGGHRAPVPPGWGSALHSRTSPSKHGPPALLQRLHVLKPAPALPLFSPPSETLRPIIIHTLRPRAPLAHAHPIHLYIRLWCFCFKLISLGIFFVFVFKSCIPLTSEAYSNHKHDCGWRDCLINTHNNTRPEVQTILSCAFVMSR